MKKPFGFKPIFGFNKFKRFFSSVGIHSKPSLAILFLIMKTFEAWALFEAKPSESKTSFLWFRLAQSPFQANLSFLHHERLFRSSLLESAQPFKLCKS